MPARMIVSLSDGNIVLFGGEPEDGMPDVGLSDGLTRVTGEEFNAAIGSIGELVKKLAASIEAMPNRPDQIEIAFGATLGRECDLWIVAADASPEFRIKLAWGSRGG